MKFIGWLIVGDGKFGKKTVQDATVETSEDSLGYWKSRGYESIPLYCSAEYEGDVEYYSKK